MLTCTDFEMCKWETGGYKDLKYVQGVHGSFVVDETCIVDDCMGVNYTNGDNCLHVPAFDSTHPRASEDDELDKLWGRN